MKKIVLGSRLPLMVALGVSLFSSLSLSSCKEKKIRSVSEMRSDEKKVINVLLNKNFHEKIHEVDNNPDIEVRDGQTYKFSNGLIMTVLDKGSGEKFKNDDDVYLYMRGELLNTDSKDGAVGSVFFSFNSIADGSYLPTYFRFINTPDTYDRHYVLKSVGPGRSLTDMMCEGLAYPLLYLRDGAKVKLIIPFSIGPEKTYTRGAPLMIYEADYSIAKNTPNA